ncbi:hypothetical protein OsI_37976 [Oryza sativa Indica Group]|uniref:Uncharacterized protein n=1 Tax=Oryza sativa subsp. indica TaxID=39946 RepID=A2ZJI6_ORYSI|nr:hypothetical protein OsI_37976 [Oryza sativa Indica Group]
MIPVPDILYEADDEDSMASDSMDEASEEELVVLDMHVVIDSMDVMAGKEVHVVANSMDDEVGEEVLLLVADSMDDAAGEEVHVVADSMDDEVSEEVLLVVADSMDDEAGEEALLVVADSMDNAAGEEMHVVADSMDDAAGEEVVMVADCMDDVAGEEVVVVADSMDDEAAEVVEVEQNKKVHSGHEFDEIKIEMWKLLLPWYFAKEECVTTGAGDNNDEVIEEERDLHNQKVHSDFEFDEIRTEMLKLLLPSYFPKKRNDSS